MERIGSVHYSEPTLPTHTSIHNDLMAYSELMLWEKMEWFEESDHDDRFGSIRDGYCKTMRQAYEAEVSQYITQLKVKLQGKKLEGKKHHHHAGSHCCDCYNTCIVSIIFTLGHKLISGASSVMDMSRNFPSSLMMTSSGSHGSLSRSTLGSSVTDINSPMMQEDDRKMLFSKVCAL